MGGSSQSHSAGSYVPAGYIRLGTVSVGEFSNGMGLAFQDVRRRGPFRRSYTSTAVLGGAVPGAGERSEGNTVFPVSEHSQMGGRLRFDLLRSIFVYEWREDSVFVLPVLISAALCFRVTSHPGWYGT